MVAIHILLNRGGFNMIKKRIRIDRYDNSEASEWQYQQKLKADQCMFQTILNSFSQYLWVPFYPYFYPYDYMVFPQTNLFANQPENNEDKEH
jgi:hypothetical protein